jgi:hypothetical protein
VLGIVKEEYIDGEYEQEDGQEERNGSNQPTQESIYNSAKAIHDGAQIRFIYLQDVLFALD